MAFQQTKSFPSAAENNEFWHNEPPVEPGPYVTFPCRDANRLEFVLALCFEEKGNVGCASSPDRCVAGVLGRRKPEIPTPPLSSHEKETRHFRRGLGARSDEIMSGSRCPDSAEDIS